MACHKALVWKKDLSLNKDHKIEKVTTRPDKFPCILSPLDCIQIEYENQNAIA